MSKAILPLSVTVSLLVLFTLFHAAVNDAKDKPLTLTVRPRVAFAPVDLALYVRLLPAESDRYLRVWIDGLNYGRSSEIPLEGLSSPKAYSLTWKRIYPADDYLVQAAVSDSMRLIRASDAQTVSLTGPNH